MVCHFSVIFHDPTDFLLPPHWFSFAASLIFFSGITYFIFLFVWSLRGIQCDGIEGWSELQWRRHNSAGGETAHSSPDDLPPHQATAPCPPQQERLHQRGQDCVHSFVWTLSLSLLTHKEGSLKVANPRLILVVLEWRTSCKHEVKIWPFVFTKCIPLC